MDRYNNGMSDTVDYRAARHQLGLTQAEVARLAGVTQPAIAAYEAGRRRPTGPAELVLKGMVAALRGRTVAAVDGRGRPKKLPKGRWAPVVGSDATIRLPTRLDWTPRREPRRDLADDRIRAGAYAQVLDEGTAADIRFWIDPDALIELWPAVPVARSLRPHVEDLVARLRQAP